MLLISYLFNQVIDLYIIVLIVAVITSWLIAFGVVNPYNQVVSFITRIYEALTEPLLVHIRRFIPPIGGLDLSILVLFIGVRAFQFAVNVYIFDPLIRSGIR